MVKRLHAAEKLDRSNNSAANKPPTSKAVQTGPARPRNNSITVSLTLLRAIHATMVTARAKLRPSLTRDELTAAITGLATRLGPAIDPAWRPDPDRPVGRPTAGYRVTSADGTVADYATRAEAAAAYGIAPTSLSVVLSKTGKASKKALHLGNPSAITVERLA